MQVSKWVTLLMAILSLIIVAAMLKSTNLYYMASVLMTLPGFSYLIGWFTLRGLEFERELPGVLWEGETGEVVYSIKNPTRYTRFFLSVSESFPDWIEAQDQEPPLFNVAARDSTRIAHVVRFLKRGVFKATSFTVQAIDPLGIFTFTKSFPCEGEIIVYPRPRRLDPLPLSGADRYGWQEFTITAPRGGSVEPDGVREYVPGDSLRRIHWRQTARTGRLAVLEFEESQSIQIAIYLDLAQGTDTGKELETTLEYAVRFAASAAQQALRQGAGIRLLMPTFDEAPLAISAGAGGRGESHFLTILDTLARVKSTSNEPVEEALSHAASSLPPGSTLVVITPQSSKALSNAVVNCATNSNSNVIVAYIDPDSFTSGKTRGADSQKKQFFNELLAANVLTLLVRQNAEGDIQPEVKRYV